MYKKLLDKYMLPIRTIPTDIKKNIKKKTRIKAAIFDIYGTLLTSSSGDIGNTDSKNLNINKIQELLDRYEIKYNPKNIINVQKEYISKEHDRLHRIGFSYPEVVIEKIWEKMFKIKDPALLKKFSIEYEMTVNPVSPMPHAVETLSALSKKNILLGILSNAQFYTPIILKYFFSELFYKNYFFKDFIFYSYKYHHAKPSLYMFELLKKSLLKKNIDLKNVIYVGNDMLNDILSASNMGMKTALFAGDKRSLRLRKKNKKCNMIKPDIIIKDLSDILEYVY